MDDARRDIRVLLVEDNPGDVRLLQELLAESAHDRDFLVTAVDRIDTAIDAVRSRTFDVVLLDLSLPDGIGIDSCRRLLAATDDCPPVIVMTGNRDRVAAAEAVGAGAQDFLVKGHVDPELLVRSIEYARERHRNQLQLRRALERETEMVGRLQELDRLKNRFVAMASHELRTPLASISGFAATLRTRWDDIEDLDRLAYIRIIDEQSARLSRLVDDLLVLSRIESGSLDAQPEPIDLRGAVQAVLDELDAEPTVHVDLPQPVRVVADRDHLEQMLVNYVSNAIKYGDAPITVQSRPHGASYVDVLVCDSGSGVPDDVAPVLFEEFVRGRGHAAARIPGTGLGLSIVRGLARAQGGDAWHEPNQPRGAVFALRLPIPSPGAG
jgi:signal transduction histidine kinase